MANYRTTQDLKKAVLKRCGELQDGSSSFDADVLEYLNSVYKGIIAGGTEFDVDCSEPWVWAQSPRPMVLTLEAAIEGTATLANGSTAVTLSSAIADSVAGWFFKPEGENEFYQILAHTAGSTAATLDLEFLGDSGSYNFLLVKTDYELPQAVCRLIAPMVNFASGVGPETGQVFEIDSLTMMKNYPRVGLSGGMPERYAVVADEDGTLTVRFSHYVTEAARLEIPYIPKPADLVDSSSSLPLMPEAFRECLVYAAAALLMADKSDDRQNTEAALANAKIKGLVSFNRKQLSLAGTRYGRLIPRRGR